MFWEAASKADPVSMSYNQLVQLADEGAAMMVGATEGEGGCQMESRPTKKRRKKKRKRERVKKKEGGTEKGREKRLRYAKYGYELLIPDEKGKKEEEEEIDAAAVFVSKEYIIPKKLSGRTSSDIH